MDLFFAGDFMKSEWRVRKEPSTLSGTVRYLRLEIPEEIVYVLVERLRDMTVSLSEAQDWAELFAALNKPVPPGVTLDP